jgi:glycosyltransferase involved in cell wall biosynthesis
MNGGNIGSTGRERAVLVVLHLTPKKRGSLEEELLALAERLRALGVAFGVAFAALPPPWYQSALVTRGARVRTLDFAAPVAAAMRLGGWLRAERQAIVHFHFVRAYSPMVAAARLGGARVIVHDHVTLTRASRSPARAAWKRLRAAALNGLVDRRVAVSSVVAESVRDIEHVLGAGVEVIENGIDVERFAAARGRQETTRRALDAVGRPLVTCVSRLAPEKGVESALRALPLVGRDAVLALVGDGPKEADWRRLATALGVGDRVRFLGVRSDVERILAASDVVVVPSHWEEAFGLAVVEGMAAGKPVVVSASGAMPELVGDAGLVVPKRDPPALAAAIGRILDDRKLAARLGRAGRVRARARFGMQRWVDRVIDLYTRLAPALAARAAA